MIDNMSRSPARKTWIGLQSSHTTIREETKMSESSEFFVGMDVHKAVEGALKYG